MALLIKNYTNLYNAHHNQRHTCFARSCFVTRCVSSSHHRHLHVAMEMPPSEVDDNRWIYILKLFRWQKKTMSELSRSVHHHNIAHHMIWCHHINNPAKATWQPNERPPDALLRFFFLYVVSPKKSLRDSSTYKPHVFRHVVALGQNIPADRSHFV